MDVYEKTARPAQKEWLHIC